MLIIAICHYMCIWDGNALSLKVFRLTLEISHFRSSTMLAVLKSERSRLESPCDHNIVTSNHSWKSNHDFYHSNYCCYHPRHTLERSSRWLRKSYPDRDHGFDIWSQWDHRIFLPGLFYLICPGDHNGLSTNMTTFSSFLVKLPSSSRHFSKQVINP